MDDSGEVHRIRRVYSKWEGTLDKTNPGYLESLRERDEALLRTINGHFGHAQPGFRVLDIGCGYGSLLNWFHEQGVLAENLFGVDLLPHRISAAHEMYPDFTFIEGNAEELDFPNGWFSLVAVFTVFSSILDGAMAKTVARNIGRVLANDGAIVWYDMRYPNPGNPNVRAMTRWRIRELFPQFQMELKQLTLLPPVARRLGHQTRNVYPLLASIPILRCHYLGLLRPPSLPLM
jgi:ubiquinone/menaquinone biosynthesis C-methylase UbiE